MRTHKTGANLARRGLTALAGLAVVAGTLVGVATPASAAISGASITPSTWTPSQQTTATVTWTESAATANTSASRAPYSYTAANSGQFLSVEVGWGWVMANRASSATTTNPVTYAASWTAATGPATGGTYTCATTGITFESPGFSNTGSGINCLITVSSTYAGNPGQMVILSNIDTSNYFSLAAGSTVTVTFPSGQITAPAAGPATDTWRINSYNINQTTTVTTVVPGVDAAGNSVSLITLDFDGNGGTCTTTKVTGVSGSWGKAPNEKDCTRPGYHFTGWNTSVNGKGIQIWPRGDINFTGDNRVYAQWFDPSAEVIPAGKPLNVVATSKWNRVQVNWDAPADYGTYPITNYLVTASPSNKVCITTLQDNKFTQCSFNSIIPGTQYTFQVQALTGAGWSERSTASNVASPYTLKITKFDRSKVLFGLAGSKIKLDLTTPGYAPGVKITPMVSYDKGAKWSKLDKDSVKTAAAIVRFVTLKFGSNYNKSNVSVKFVDADGNESNTVVVPPAK